MSRKFVIEIDEEHPFVRKTNFVNDEDKAYAVKGTSLIIHEEELNRLTTLDNYILERFDILLEELKKEKTHGQGNVENS